MSPSKQPASGRDISTSNASSISNEADDERSWASPPTMAQRNTRRGSQYEGEDRRPTSAKELRGFYAYSWASEVFVICGMGSFIPITIEQLARERGVLSTDHSMPCSKSMNHTSPGPNTVSSKPVVAPQCVIQILGLEINTASFAMYTFSISVFIQFLLIISMSGAADHGSYRKTLLVVFATTGAVACMLFLPITPQVILLGALLAIVANTCFGASSVLLNSFLPLLVRNHPDVWSTDMPEEDYSVATPESGAPEGEPSEEDSVPNQAAPLLSVGQDVDLIDCSTPSIAALDMSTRISSIGVGIGYIAALLVQVFSIYIVRATGSTLSSLRLVIFIIGAWWLLFTIPGAMWLRPRPGPPLHISHSAGRVRTLIAYASYSWKSLGYSLMRARKLKDVLIFLAAWFLLSDAIATVTGTAVLFAKTSLDMSLGGLALINVVVTISGIVGAFAWRYLSDMMGLKPSQTVLLCILIFELVPLYGLLGYLPLFKQWGVGGLQQGWEMYPLSAVFGFVLGGLSSFCRSIFGELVPPGFETAFYSLYAITDKGSSIFGPAIVGAITDATGEIRPAFFFLAALVAAPFPILMAVNTERGKRDGIALAKELADADKVQDDVDAGRLLESGYDNYDRAL